MTHHTLHPEEGEPAQSKKLARSVGMPRDSNMTQPVLYCPWAETVNCPKRSGGFTGNDKRPTLH